MHVVYLDCGGHVTETDPTLKLNLISEKDERSVYKVCVWSFYRVFKMLVCVCVCVLSTFEGHQVCIA